MMKQITFLLFIFMVEESISMLNLPTGSVGRMYVPAVGKSMLQQNGKTLVQPSSYKPGNPAMPKPGISLKKEHTTPLSSSSIVRSSVSQPSISEEGDGMTVEKFIETLEKDLKLNKRAEDTTKKVRETYGILKAMSEEEFKEFYRKLKDPENNNFEDVVSEYVVQKVREEASKWDNQ